MYGEDMNERKRKIALQRICHTISGQVQGVGFRPFLFQLAKKYGLVGSVKNTPKGVVLEVQGTAQVLSYFTNELLSTLPPLVRIGSHSQEVLPLNVHEDSFRIVKSIHGEAGGGHDILISPDIGICAECVRDVEEHTRRKGYAFTNCTNCGPRYSITHSVPYDRESTSMACFPLCPDCKAEYENVHNRRFHAQPNACPHCGPMVWFAKEATHSQLHEALARGEQAIESAAQLIHAGGIVALKGLGGFQLVCDASNAEAVTRLRHKKQRPDKPFAIMTNTLLSAQKIACVSSVAEKWLVSPEKPITLCPIHEETFFSITPSIAPQLQRIGIMLPYTPLHHLLLQAFAKIKGLDCKSLPALVMTSGNKAGEPIALSNREALATLENIAEGWLFHNRDILVRVDDSVVLPVDEEDTGKSPLPEVVFLRRARGFAPLPITFMGKKSAGKNIHSLEEHLSPKHERGEAKKNRENHDTSFSFQEYDSAPVVMGAGADMKNTFCITKGNNAFVSQHIGTMHNLETEDFYLSAQKHLTRLLSVAPEYIVRDLHPNYAVNRVVEHLGAPMLTLQHHAAHAFSVLGENVFQGKALVLALDGTGFGEGGELWGGEALIADMKDGSWSRVGHLSRIPLPGGDIVVKEPWRVAHALMVEQGLLFTSASWLPAYASIAEHIPHMMEKKLNTPYSTSCGRLFDAVSALLGICLSTTYEGQAAVLLEQAQWSDRASVSFGQKPAHQNSPVTFVSPLSLSALPEEKRYAMPIIEEEGTLILESRPMFNALWDERGKGISLACLSRKFHQSLAYGLCELSERLCRQYNLHSVGLSGGVMQNTTLLYLICKELHRRGITPLTHSALPSGDGGISFGQGVWGAISLQAKNC